MDKDPKNFSQTKAAQDYLAFMTWEVPRYVFSLFLIDISGFLRIPGVFAVWCELFPEAAELMKKHYGVEDLATMK